MSDSTASQATVLAFPVSDAAIDAMERVPPRYHRVIKALVEHGGNCPSAAKELKLHRSTVAEIAGRPEVKRALAAASVESMRTGLARTMALYSKSIDTMEALLSSKSGWQRLEAARALAGFGLRALEIAEMHQRLTAIEDALQQRRNEQV